jgi:hypothetical protein
MRSRPNSALQPLAHDLQVQQPEEAAAEAEAQRSRRLRLERQGGVVELELVERLAQVGIVRPVDRIQTGEHHRFGVAVAPERRRGRLARVGDRVTDARLAHVLHAGNEIADLAHAKSIARHRFRGDDADLEELVLCLGRHHHDPLARIEVAVDHPDIGHDAAVGVIDRVENHRARGRIRVADRCRELPNDLCQKLFDTLPRLAGHLQAVLGIAPDQPGELRGILLRLRGGQIDLVQDRDDGEVVLHREIEIGQRLRLDPLRGVDEQHRPLAGGETAGHLIREIDVPGCVDHVQRVGRPVQLPRHPHRLGLDGDAALALDVHPVEILRAHGALVDDAGQLQHPIGKGRLAVIDVGDDAEVADQLRRRGVRLQRGAGAGVTRGFDPSSRDGWD